MSIVFILLVLLLTGAAWLLRARLRRRVHGWRRPVHGPRKHFKPAPAPAPRRSGGKPKPAWAIDEVLALHALSPGGYRQIAAAFNRLHAHSGVTIAYSTVRNWLKKHSAELKEIQARLRHQVPRHTPANRRWCLDATGKCDASGRQHFIFGILDHGSRKNLALIRMDGQTAKSLLEQVLRACRRYGKPRFIRTDNAAVFHSAIFRKGLADAHIAQEFSAPGKPWQNGRIERFFLTLKEKLNCVVPMDGAALDLLLAEFRIWYNALRPHQHLHGLTPDEVWRGVDPYRRRPRSVEKEMYWHGMLSGWRIRY